MNQSKMTQVIETRKIQVLRNDGTTETIKIEIGRPALGPAPYFYSPYRITGIGIDKRLFGAGVDEIDALQSAMIMVGIELEHLQSQAEGTLSWLGGEEGDLGFPPIPKPRVQYGRSVSDLTYYPRESLAVGMKKIP